MLSRKPEAVAKAVEIIPTQLTSENVVEHAGAFVTPRLGKTAMLRDRRVELVGQVARRPRHAALPS
ncbi:hypothetical protein [Streptomyces sp. NPDC018833]|uniref:hypothetical protein n=1 Tax=Streptomyces sp. NPDC018833 TaxID=3365053 RepID=UPI0037BC45F9